MWRDSNGKVLASSSLGPLSSIGMLVKNFMLDWTALSSTMYSSVCYWLIYCYNMGWERAHIPVYRCFGLSGTFSVSVWQCVLHLLMTLDAFRVARHDTCRCLILKDSWVLKYGKSYMCGGTLTTNRWSVAVSVICLLDVSEQFHVRPDRFVVRNVFLSDIGEFIVRIWDGQEHRFWSIDVSAFLGLLQYECVCAVL